MISESCEIFNKVVPIDYLTVNVIKQSSRKLEPSLEKKVVDGWKAYEDDYKSQGKDVWNGPLYRLENLEELRKGSSNILISPDFDFAHSRLITENDLRNLPSEYDSNTIATIAIVETSDEYTIWETQRNSTNSEPITLLGGALQPDELQVESFRDFYNNLLKEVCEESLLTEDDIELAKLFSIVRKNRGSTILFCYYLKLNKDSKYVSKQLKLALRKGESEKFELVERISLNGFLDRMPNESIIRTVGKSYQKLILV